jgi:Mn2+/Fe2+ NRAMP family transporter
MKPRELLQLGLGILTAIGGFLDVGATATAGEAGAKFGLGLVWALLLATVAIIQLLLMVGRFTARSHKPYAAAVREHLGFKFYLLPLTAELTANCAMLTAELGGVAIALSLLTGFSWHVLYPVAAVALLLTLWFAPFEVIENGPALLGLVTLSFAGAVIALHGPSPEVLKTLVVPQVSQNQLVEYLFLAAAILGAIISPYLIYFYSSGAREEEWGQGSLHINRVTAVLGMSFGCLVALSLMLLGAIVLQPKNIQVATLGDIGLAMATPWGRVGATLFALGLLVTCFGAALEIGLAVPYEVSQGFGWSVGKNKPKRQAARFNLLILLIVLAGIALGLFGIDPLQLTLYASAFTAVVLPLSLFPFLVIMNDRDYLGDLVNGRVSNWVTIGILSLASLVALVTLPLTFLSGGGG